MLKNVQYIVLVIFTLALRADSLAFLTSKRARCSIECYMKCVTAGTPKAVYCNCPASLELQSCDTISEEVIKMPQVETSYKDVRTISIKMEPYNGAFIYIFEYSTISGESEYWSFAGASSSPQIQFNIPDACRDYQFRAIVVLRSTDPALQLVVFRPRAIPVQLPQFVVPPESIHLDQPRQSNDDQSLHIFVSWQNPFGYDDADIYGYDQPVAYPISCQTPEDKLTQPRVELVEGGARMHLNLPIDVLSEKCRIFVEARMLPRCVRIESFDIQASIDLNCDKFPYLSYCKKDQTPQCISIVDVWGKDGKAMIVWQQPAANPLYYIIKYGMGEQRGARPFIARKILQGEEVKISGNVSHAELVARPGIEYGLQVCGIYSTARNKPPFEVAPVIPFICAECPSDAVDCIDCAKIEDAPAQPYIPVVECGNEDNCTNVAHAFVTKNSATLELASTNSGHWPQIGLSTDSRDTAANVPTLPNPTTTRFRSPTRPTNAGPAEDLSHSSFEDITVNSHEASGNGMQSGYGERVRHRFTAPNPVEPVTAPPTDTPPAPPMPEARVLSTARRTHTPPTTTENVSEVPYNETDFVVTTLPTVANADTSTNNLVDAVRAVLKKPKESSNEVVRGAKTHNAEDAAPIVGEVALVPIPPASSGSSEATPRLDGVRLHQQEAAAAKKQPCKQKSGVICEFGCVDDIRCECKRNDSAAPCIRGLFCPKITDLRAVYENKTMHLRLYSKTVAQLLNEKSADGYDKLYMEFGELSPKPTSSLHLRKPQKGSSTYIFSNGRSREHAMLELSQSASQSLFDQTPYEIKMDSPLNVHERVYGLSVCALNSTLVPVILDNVYIEQSIFNDNSITAITQSLLSPVDLSEELEAKQEAHRGFLIFLGPAFLVLGILIFGVTILCMGMVQRHDSAARLRRRGLLRSQSGMQFTAYRPTLGVSPSSFYSDNTSRYYMTRNVHF